jgi:tripartite-type tricarboxylate transporter receptor subunit TctC
VKPVRIVVPYPPGGSNDVLARHLAQKLNPALGQNVLIDNRAGASGAIGAEHVAKAPADGYTLLFNSGSFAASAAAEPRLAFNTEKDFVAIGAFGVGPMLLLVHPSLPAKSVKELVALAKKRPGELNFSSSGTAGINHLATEYFKHAAKIDIVHVPYKGMSPAITDLIAGQVQILITTFPSIGGQLKSGRVRPLAVTSPKRSQFAPELPTVIEAGVPGYEVPIWWGLFGPANLPRPIVDRLNREMRAMLQTADIREKLAREGAEATLTTPEEFDAMLRGSIATWRRVIKEGNIKLE